MNISTVLSSRPVRPVTEPLAGMDIRLRGEGLAVDYAEQLLASWGVSTHRLAGPAVEHPALAWARSGAMALTGYADSAGQMCPSPLAACVDGALLALRSLVPEAGSIEWPDCRLLGERAAVSGLWRAGDRSPGGACRLLPTADDWLAVSLAREQDWDLLPAWLDLPPVEDWPAVAAALRREPVRQLLERGRLLGLALGMAEGLPQTRPWYRIEHDQRRRAAPNPDHRPLVVDFSSLWAGPLCSHLLSTLGAQVVKVESRRRPDGARSGPQPFNDLMNAGKASVAVDLTDSCDRDRLRRLLLQADIVIEASRPRALRQLGFDAEEIIDANPGLTWIGISGHGRAEPAANWIAYGDDAGVDAGLASLMRLATGRMMFCGDAIADPLAGVHAAFAAWSSYRAGGGRLISLALRDVACHCASYSLPEDPEAIRERCREWQRLTVASGVADALPVARTPTGKARPLGADTDAILGNCSC
jgi:hypothetical protein